MEPFECPDTPPADYPKGFPAMDVINHWNPDDAEHVPPSHYLSTCRWVGSVRFGSVQFVGGIATDLMFFGRWTEVDRFSQALSCLCDT